MLGMPMALKWDPRSGSKGPQLSTKRKADAVSAFRVFCQARLLHCLPSGSFCASAP